MPSTCSIVALRESWCLVMNSMEFGVAYPIVNVNALVRKWQKKYKNTITPEGVNIFQSNKKEKQMTVIKY